METTNKNVVYLTTQEFKDSIFDYELSEDWSYKGNGPAIIDFYADWCNPCKMVGKVLEDVAKDYDEKLTIYKINTETEQELAAVFNISSIPTLLFIPQEGKPQMAVGGLGRAQFDEIINDFLLKTK